MIGRTHERKDSAATRTTKHLYPHVHRATLECPGGNQDTTTQGSSASGLTPHTDQPAPVHTRQNQKASTESHAGNAANRDGIGLGRDGEEAVAQSDRDMRQDMVEDISLKPDPALHDDLPPQNTAGVFSSSSVPVPSASDEARAGRGPDKAPRHLRASTDEGTNPDNPTDWTGFGIGRVLRVFRTNNEASIRQSLRTCHVRRWHGGGEHTRKRCLDNVGVSHTVF